MPNNEGSQLYLFCKASGTHIKQLMSARPSRNSNRSLTSYVIVRAFWWVRFRCSSYILTMPSMALQRCEGSV